MNNQTLLCFDFGKKRIGAAVGQTITATATALETIKVNQGKPDWDRITELVNEWQPDKVIIGKPLTLNGERQEMTDLAERFSRQIKNRYKLPIEMMEEQLTSYEARRHLKSTRNLDPVAAKLILESWLNEFLDSRHRQNAINKEN